MLSSQDELRHNAKHDRPRAGKEMTKMKDYISALKFEIETAEEVFEHWDMKPRFKWTVKENPYGGNPELIVKFDYTGKIQGREKVFRVNPASCSVEMFVNELKAYLYDCVYGFVSILF